MKELGLLIFFCLLPPSLVAEDIRCGFEGITNGRTYCIEHSADWFFDTTVVDGVEYILYTENKNGNHRSKAINTETGEEFYLPGKVDPVANGNMLTVPIKNSDNKFELNFFSLKDLIAAKGDVSSIEASFVDKTMSGNYQSIGKLFGGENNINRIIY